MAITPDNSISIEIPISGHTWGVSIWHEDLATAVKFKEFCWLNLSAYDFGHFQQSDNTDGTHESYYVFFEFLKLYDVDDPEGVEEFATLVSDKLGLPLEIK